METDKVKQAIRDYLAGKITKEEMEAIVIPKQRELEEYVDAVLF